MDPRVVTTLKLAAFAIIGLFAFSIVSKNYKRYNRKEALATEMRTLVSDPSFYRCPTTQSAHSVLLRGIAVIDRAKSLGLEPSAFFDKVFRRDKKSEKPINDEFEEYPTREKLARDTMLRAYQHAEQMGLLARLEYRDVLDKGSIPDVVPSPKIACIIDPAVSPGIEKIVPNLELRLPGPPAAAPSDLETAAAKSLAADLYSARVIEHDAEARIAEYYDKVKQKPQP
jgi:hypothetical protein